MHQCRISADKFAELLYHAQPCGRMNVHRCAALDGIRGEAGLGAVQ
jgi:hypothetical protein